MELRQKYKNLLIKIAAIDVSNAEEANNAISDFYRTTNSIDLLFNNAGYVKKGTSDIDSSATKAAILAFNESLYKELRDTNIKVTALCPGFVDTEMTSDVKEDRNKLIKTKDICIAVDFLLSLSPAVALKKLSFESIVQVANYN